MSKRKLTVAALLLFFFGLPLAGVIYSYQLAKGAIAASATEFVQKEAPRILGSHDYERLWQLGTIPLKKSLSQEMFKEMLRPLGKFQGMGAVRAGRVTMGSRDDQSWQMIQLTAPVKFSGGAATLKFKAARRSTALEDWRVEEFQVLPVGME